MLDVGFHWHALVVWFCVTTGAVLEVSISAFTTSVWELARQLYTKLQPDDVVVADSAYGTYVDKSVDPLSQCGCSVPLNIMSVTVISAPCKKLGIGDHIVRWQRPKRGPQSISLTDFCCVTGNHRSAVRFIC